MLIRFVLNENGFSCIDAPTLASISDINYIKCHFDFKTEAWRNVDAITAIFKSATYNKVSEVVLDSNNDCYIDPEIYKNGGTIQCKVVGDKFRSGAVTSSTHATDIIEFYINENVILPTPIPSKYDVVVAELVLAKDAITDAIADLNQKVADGYFDGADGVGIASVSYNEDGTVDITLTDGTSYTSVYSMKGESGEPGADGVGISNIVYGEDGTLTITMSDGDTYTSEYSMKGEQGEPGSDGESGFSPIANVTQAGSVITITITDEDGTTTATIDLSSKQDVLIAGTGIDITDGVISVDLDSAEGGSY